MTSSLATSRFDRFLRCGGVAVLVCVVGALGIWRSTSYYGTILRGWDAQIYYAAARSLVVSRTADTTESVALSPGQHVFTTEYGLPRRPDGGVKNVSPVGLSLIEAAFLLPARWAREFGIGVGPPGYSRFEVTTVAVGLLVITAVGLQVLYGYVRRLAPPAWSFAVILAAWAGTPLLYYTTWFPLSVHPATLALMVFLLAVAERLPDGRAANRLVFAFGVLSALLYLTRPHQSPYLLILAGWRVAPVMRRPWREWVPGTVAGLAVCAAALLFQCGVHQLNTGSFTPLAHGVHNHPFISGSFDWLHPQYGVVLWAPDRGLFWMTPVVAVALLGYVLRPRVIPWWGWASLINAAIQTAILAAWSDARQGDSFGIRLWCEHLPVVACGLAVLTRLPRPWRAVASVAVVLCVVWTTLLMAAYIFNRLDPAGTHADALRAAFGVG